MFRHFNLEAKRFQPAPLRVIVLASNRKGDVVNRAVFGTNRNRAIEQAEYLSMTAIAFGDLQQHGRLKATKNLEAEHVTIELLHPLQIIDSERDLAESLDCGSFTHDRPPLAKIDAWYNSNGRPTPASLSEPAGVGGGPVDHHRINWRMASISTTGS
jgi:hypothetical protein